MPDIGTLTDFQSLTRIRSSEVDANFEAIKAAFNTSAVLTDVIKTISVSHTWSAKQLLPFVGARARLNANTSVPDSTFTALPLAAEPIDSDAFHDNATNNSRITVPAGLAGKYLVIGKIGYAANATGYRQVTVRKNGSASLEVLTNTTVSALAQHEVMCAGIYTLAVADYLELLAYQTSGGALNAIAGDFYTALTLIFMGT